MHLILNEPHPDELFNSFIYRLSRGNGLDMQSFVGRVLYNLSDSHKVSRIKWNNDGRGLFAPFFRLFPGQRFNIIQNHSVYPFLAPFLTANRQSMVINSLFNGKIDNRPQLLTDLYYCKECRQEDLERYGHTYLRRAHQLPGVSLCYKHHTPLFSTKTDTPAAPGSLEYALFAKDFLDKNLQTTITQLQTIDGLPPISTSYDRIPEILRFLMQMFGNVEHLASVLPPCPEFHSDDYEVVSPFCTTVQEVRHRCGNVFLTSGFFPKCPACAKVSGQNKKPFIERVADLTGDEYTVLSVDKKKAILRHNLCGHIQTFHKRHFLQGSRCSECTKIVSFEKFPEQVAYMTNNQYHVTRNISRNLWEIQEVGGQTIETSIPCFLQEILRPTPSDILPVPVKDLKKDWDVWDSPVISRKDLFQKICSLYTDTDIIFMDDLHKHFPPKFDKTLKHGIRQLIADHKLLRIETGIYSLAPVTISPEAMIEQKYLIRNGERIGIYDSKSLAYVMGIVTEPPDTLYIMTNKESLVHGRKRIINGLPVHIRGNPVVIGNDNYQYVMVMEAIKYSFHYGSGRNYRIRQFIREHNLSLEPFISLFPYYSETIQKCFNSLWRSL